MTTPHDPDNWARPVDRLHVADAPPGTGGRASDARNVAGRRLTGPIHGFGPMWQKTYRVLVGDTPPEQVIATWKAHAGELWPAGNRLYAPVAGIRPGEIALISSTNGPVELSTGVMVIYADDLSFAFMTPEGHPFSGIITFSAAREEAGTVAQVQLLIRPSDPLFDLVFGLVGSRREDRMWCHVLRELALRLGSDTTVETAVTCVDKRRQWRYFSNLRHSSMLHLRRRQRG